MCLKKFLTGVVALVVIFTSPVRSSDECPNNSIERIQNRLKSLDEEITGVQSTEPDLGALEADIRRRIQQDIRLFEQHMYTSSCTNNATLKEIDLLMEMDNWLLSAERALHTLRSHIPELQITQMGHLQNNIACYIHQLGRMDQAAYNSRRNREPQFTFQSSFNDNDSPSLVTAFKYHILETLRIRLKDAQTNIHACIQTGALANKRRVRRPDPATSLLEAIRKRSGREGGTPLHWPTDKRVEPEWDWTAGRSVLGAAAVDGTSRQDAFGPSSTMMISPRQQQDAIRLLDVLFGPVAETDAPLATVDKRDYNWGEYITPKRRYPTEDNDLRQVFQTQYKPVPTQRKRLPSWLENYLETL